MIEQRPAREAPAEVPLTRTDHDPTRPPVPNEPVLALNNIQGNIIGGFNKDHQMLLFLRHTKHTSGRQHV